MPWIRGLVFTLLAPAVIGFLVPSLIDSQARRMGGVGAVFPCLRRRGGCGIKETMAKPPNRRRRRGRNAFPETFRRKRPPRPLLSKWLRDIFLMSRPPLLRKQGFCTTEGERYTKTQKETQEAQKSRHRGTFLLCFCVLFCAFCVPSPIRCASRKPLCQTSLLAYFNQSDFVHTALS